MRIPRALFFLLSVIAVLPIAFLAWAASDTGQYEICDSSVHTGRKECSNYELIPFVTIKASQFFNDASAFITALATVVIAAFTITIAKVNQHTLGHGRKVERAYVSAGGARKFGLTETSPGSRVFQPVDTGLFEFHVNNHGKTQGRVYRIGWNFCEESAVPNSEPVYQTKYFKSEINPGRSGIKLDDIPIPQGLLMPAVYGRVYYETIFGDCFSSGFLYRIPAQPQGSESISPPNPSYIDEREETCPKDDGGEPPTHRGPHSN